MIPIRKIKPSQFFILILLVLFTAMNFFPSIEDEDKESITSLNYNNNQIPKISTPHGLIKIHNDSAFLS